MPWPHTNLCRGMGCAHSLLTCELSCRNAQDPERYCWLPTVWAAILCHPIQQVKQWPWMTLLTLCLGSLSLTQSLQLHSFGNTEGENGNQTLTWPFSPLSWHLCHPKESWRSTARWVQIGTMCAQMESFSCPAWRVSDKVLFLKTL